MADENGVPPPATQAAVTKLIAGIGSGGHPGMARALPAREDPEEQLRFQREMHLRRLRLAFETVPERYRWAEFDNPLLRDRVTPVGAIAAAKRAGGSILLLGPSGSGKTSLGVACMRLALDDGTAALKTRNAAIYKFAVGAMFVTAYDLAKAGVYSPLGRRPKLVDRAMQASLLLLDELGMDIEVFKQSATSVREVLHERHANGRPTIATSFLRGADLRGHYGEGIERRFKEGAVIVLGGELA